MVRGQLPGLTAEQTTLSTSLTSPPSPVPQDLGMLALTYTKLFCQHSKQANVFTKHDNKMDNQTKLLMGSS